MKKLFVFFSAFLFVSIFFKSQALAAPARWGIAINEDQEECAGYWAGDEYHGYTLPEGWKAYYPDYDYNTGKTILETPFGNCDPYIDEQYCCNELGFDYTSDNIGNGYDTDKDKLGGMLNPWPIFIACASVCCLLAIAIAVVTAFIVIKKKK